MQNRLGNLLTPYSSVTHSVKRVPIFYRGICFNLFQFVSLPHTHDWFLAGASKKNGWRAPCQLSTVPTKVATASTPYQVSSIPI